MRVSPNSVLLCGAGIQKIGHKENADTLSIATATRNNVSDPEVSLPVSCLLQALMKLV